MRHHKIQLLVEKVLLAMASVSGTRPVEEPLRVDEDRFERRIGHGQ
jgi:hypothetical protein